MLFFLLLRFFEHQLNERMNEWVCIGVDGCVCECCAVLCYVKSASECGVCMWLNVVFIFSDCIVTRPICAASYCCLCFATSLACFPLTRLRCVRTKFSKFFSFTYCHFVLFVAHFVYTQLMMMMTAAAAAAANDICWKLNEFKIDSLCECMQIYHKLFYFVVFLW